MRMKIISGKFGGLFIEAPKNSATHPMSERARAAIFNSLNNAIKGAKILDAFAGSGAVGIEAISRGGESVIFIEKNRQAAKTIEQNCQKLQLQNQAKIINTTVNNWIETAAATYFDIIFADPPYHDLQFNSVLKLMDLLEDGGLLILSHSGKKELPQKDSLKIIDTKNYGNAFITFYKKSLTTKN